MYRIKSLQIKNFKCLKDHSFDFGEKNLVLFDGPNGYGKTTVYDALEIAFTGNLRRFKDNTNIKQSVGYGDSSFHKDKTKPIEIGLNLHDRKGNKLYIFRKYPSASDITARDKNPRNFFEKIEQYSIQLNGKNVEDQTLGQLLNYESIEKFFNILDYVEQDENTYFIKKSAKDKYNGLSELLGINNHNDALKKTSEVIRAINAQERTLGEQLTRVKEENKAILESEGEDIIYNRLVEIKELPWDKKDLVISQNEVRINYLSELQKLSYLKSNEQLIEKIIKANSIRELLESSVRIDNLVRNYWNVVNIETLIRENEQRGRESKEKESLTIVSKSIETKDYKTLQENQEALKLVIEQDNIYEELKEMIRELLSLKNLLSAENRLIEEIRDKRNSFLEAFTKSSESLKLVEDGICPTCSHDWGSKDELLSQFKETEELIFKSNDISREKLRKAQELWDSKMEELTLLKRISDRVDQIEKNRLALIGLDEFLKVSANQANWSEEFEKILDLFSKDQAAELIELFNQRLKQEELEDVIESVRSKAFEFIPHFNADLKIDELRETFQNQLDNSLEELRRIQTETVEQKIKYIHYAYFNGISKKISNIEANLVKLEATRKKCTDVSDLLKEQINSYLKGIIANITAPFYIYTSKILQNHSLGTGLVFNADIDKATPEIMIHPLGRKQEASFSLSSGQLSATVISLMLVLNKVYNQNDLGVIMIDDPIQTLDEINTHSLIELLKHNFSDEQVILSTHEDKYSRFIRYKYERFGLSHDNIEMRREI
ncbi:DNA double-strand break repair ATPase Rad50 [Fulvivirga kasyanovii]|uniref:Rad50/SbcC-type AAA domain-containing protein n=1 Tax=Fulvivirga kasyanovii TaxID=396812 RepID=A0ABW9RJV7_9BACT|nr:AAA family ATPase [Fulvivirga kasyanovii]MTI24362.1 hypothetical protein [Fulvivirga kasyanovii]